MLHNIGQSGGSLYFLWQRQVPGGVRASEGLSYTELHRVTPSPLYLFLWWVLGPDSTQFPVCQLPAADLHRLSPGSNNPLLTVLLWLEEFTCIWNSLARQILWTDPRTIFQCCYNTPDYLHPCGLQGCCPGRQGRAPLNGSSKCLNYPRTLYKYQFFTARYLIFDHCVPWPSSWECIQYPLRYTQTWCTFIPDNFHG